MKKSKIVLLFLLNLFPMSYVNAESIILLSSGLSAAPAYEGSKKYLVDPTVDSSYSYLSDDYGVFSLSLKGAAWGIGVSDNLTLVSKLGYDGGRQEKLGVIGQKNEDLNGMGDIEGSLLIGFDLYYNLENYELYVTSDIGTKNRNYGGRDIGRTTKIELGVNAYYEINNKWGIDYNLATIWGNKSYNQAYFGVSKQQAKNSQFAEYKATRGFNDVHSTVVINYRVNNNLSLYTGIGSYYLIGNAAKSSLTAQKLGFVGLGGINYQF